MFGIVRIIAGILIGAILLAFLCRYKKVNRWMKVSIVVFVIAFITAAAFVPVENTFYCFESAEDVYKYYLSGETRTDLVIEGEYADFVVGARNGIRTYLIAPKTENGWKLAMGKDTRKIARSFSEGISVDVYQYKDTDDYFIAVLDTNGGTSDISGDGSTVFYPLAETNDALDKTYVTYYAYIRGWNPQYRLTVNGVEIPWNNW